MIDWLEGTIITKEPTYLLLNVNGVGYGLSISLMTHEKLNEMGEKQSLFVHFLVRENDIRLFGFYSEKERKFFRELINVSGIGPRTAISMLSSYEASDLEQIISSGNEKALTRVPGIGKKTAQRLIFELQAKMGARKSIQDSLRKMNVNLATQQNAEEAVLALVALGYKQKDVETIVYRLSAENPEYSTVELLVRHSLKELN